MKRKLYILLTALFVLGLATAIFAFSQGPALAFFAGTDEKSCCAKKDSCPMKDHQAGDKKHACCDNCACCKDGACAMKHGEKGATASCENCKCCGDSCPMKKKDGQTKTENATVAATEGEGCCCACCKKKET